MAKDKLTQASEKRRYKNTLKEDNKKTILLTNCINTDNLGDRIIGEATKDLFEKAGFNTISIDYFLNGKYPIFRKIFPTITKRIVIKKCIKALKRSDALVIGGGELLSGQGLLYDSLLQWNALVRKYNPSIKKYIFACGAVDNYPDKNICEILSSFDAIYMRDQYSKDVIRSIVRQSDVEVKEIPDCVFSLSTQKYTKRDHVCIGITSPTRYNNHRKQIFKNIQDYINYHEIIINNVTKEYPKSKIYLIYNTKKDKEYAKLIYRKNRHNKLIKVAKIRTETDLIRIIASSKFVISPRMHALIIAIISNVDYEIIEISNKMHSFRKKYQKNVKVEKLKEEVQYAVSSIREKIEE